MRTNLKLGLALLMLAARTYGTGTPPCTSPPNCYDQGRTTCGNQYVCIDGTCGPEYRQLPEYEVYACYSACTGNFLYNKGVWDTYCCGSCL